MHRMSGVAKNPGSVASVGASSSVVVAKNDGREYLVVVAPQSNTSIVWLALGPVAVAGQGIPLYPGGSWERPTPPAGGSGWTGPVAAVGASAGQSLTVSEV